MTSNTPETQARDLAQFFFEMGFGACYAEAIVRNGNQVPFPLSDAEIERQWAISQEAYDDADELEAMLSLARHRQSSSNAGGVGVAAHVETLNWLSSQYLPGGPRDVKGAIRAAVNALTPKELCEHGHTDPMQLCSGCEANSSALTRPRHPTVSGRMRCGRPCCSI